MAAVPLLTERFTELAAQFAAVEATKRHERSALMEGDYVDNGLFLNWKVKARDLISKVCGKESEHYKEFVRHEKPSSMVTNNYRILLRLKPIFFAVKEDYEKGYLNPSTGNTSGAKDRDIILMLAERFHGVVRQLRQRHDNRPTLDVVDEYDVQDLFHALLTIYFDDIRKEEWAPSYAGGASRMDFLLPEIEAVVETKMMRPSLSTKQLGEQLIVDIAKYKSHPSCRTLFCVVYDPDGRIANPRGVENDLSTQDQRLVTRVMIVPKQ
jgi:REase_DpnII-MboI